MFERVKNALAHSYIGAIMLGWIFAQAIIHLVSVLTTPLFVWLQDRANRSVLDSREILDHRKLWQSAMPSLTTSAALFLIGFGLLYWLYIIPNRPALDTEPPEVAPNP